MSEVFGLCSWCGGVFLSECERAPQNLFARLSSGPKVCATKSQAPRLKGEWTACVVEEEVVTVMFDVISDRHLRENSRAGSPAAISRCFTIAVLRRTICNPSDGCFIFHSAISRQFASRIFSLRKKSDFEIGKED